MAAVVVVLVLALLTEVKVIALDQFNKSVNEENAHMGQEQKMSVKVGKWFKKRLPAGLDTLHSVGASLILPAIAVQLA